MKKLLQVMGVLAFVSLSGVGCETGPPVERQILEALAPACRGQGVEQASAYTGEPPAPIVMLDAGKSHFPAHYWMNDMPKNWLPTALSDAQLVACVTVESVLTDRLCPYEGAVVLPLERFEAEIDLREARTGKLVATETIYGGDCPRLASPKQEAVLGSFVKWDDVETWLTKYVTSDLQ